MGLFEDLLPEVLPEVPGVSDPLAAREIRNATIRLCKEAKILKVDASPVTTLANIGTYALTLPADREFEDIRSLTIDYEPMVEYSEDALDLEFAGCDWRSKTDSTPEFYYVLRADGVAPAVRLVGIPTVAGKTLRARLALSPSRTAVSVDDFVANKYFTAIAHGAISNLLKIPKKQWTDLQSAAVYASWFEDGIGKAREDAARDHTRDDETVLRVRSHP